MTLLPRSLLWRTFFLIATLMVLAALAWAAIFTRAERAPQARQLAQMVASMVNLTRTALLTTQPDKRLDLLIELSDREGIRIYPAESDDALEPLPEDQAFIQMVAAEIRRKLGDRTRITLSRDGEPGFWTSFQIDGDDEYWLMLPRERVDRRQPLHWLGWVAATLLLALIGAYFVVFRVTRPLKRLSQAARQIGQGQRPYPLAETGPEEIRSVSHAFNQMSSDLARLDEDRALILAGISHDLRTPLARLRLATEMGVPDEALRTGIAADIDEIDKIIGQFLDFARNGEGEAEQPLDLNDIVTDGAQALQRHGTRLELHLQELPLLTLRPLALRRLLSNLINNALNHGGGHAPVDIVTRREGHQIVLEVMDRGPGIPTGEGERLKQPFTRLETARTGAHGAGLGLAIVDRVARMHDGHFELLPREGGGLIARIRLPAKKPD